MSADKDPLILTLDPQTHLTIPAVSKARWEWKKKTGRLEFEVEVLQQGVMAFNAEMLLKFDKDVIDVEIWRSDPKLAMQAAYRCIAPALSPEVIHHLLYEQEKEQCEDDEEERDT